MVEFNVTAGGTDTNKALVLTGKEGAPGVSAYATAVKGGYVGTEAQWVASLKGVKGDTGIQGIQGLKGDTGNQGIQGVKGDKGDTGIQGVKGDKGDTGIQGVKGDKGDKGDTGSVSGVAAVAVSGSYTDLVNVPKTISSIKSLYDYGAKMDGAFRQDGRIVAGSLSTLSCDNYQFKASDVGKVIVVGNATNVSMKALVTTIASVTSGKATLATPSARAIVYTSVAWGTDDGPAWLAAITDLVSGPGGTAKELRVPAGVSICGNSMAFSLGPDGPSKISIKGAGAGISTVVSTKNTGFLAIDCAPEGRFSASNAANASRTSVEGLTLLATMAGNGTAISINSLLGSIGIDTPSAIVRDVTCESFYKGKGSDNIIGSGYWDVGIKVTNSWMPVLSNITVSHLEEYQPVPGSGSFANSSFQFASQLGVDISGCYSPYLNRVVVKRCARGIQAISDFGVYGNPVIGGCITDSITNGCKEGIVVSTNGSFPMSGLRITNCLNNNRDINVYLKNVSQAIISGGEYSETPEAWSISSTLASPIPTGSTPATITLASTDKFPIAGAVFIGSEWFTYDNLTQGMDGVTLNVLSRGEFATVDPGIDYAAGTVVTPSFLDILIRQVQLSAISGINFSLHGSAKRISLLAVDSILKVSLSNCRYDTLAFPFGFGNLVSNCQAGSLFLTAGMKPGLKTRAPDFRFTGVPVPVSVTDDYTVQTTDEIIDVNPYQKNIVVTLPVDPTIGTRITVNRFFTGANTVKVQTLDKFFSLVGSPKSMDLAFVGHSITFYYIGSSWRLLGGNLPLTETDKRYPVWYNGTNGILPATAASKLKTQSGNTLDDGSGVMSTVGNLAVGGNLTISGTSLSLKDSSGKSWTLKVGTDGSISIT